MAAVSSAADIERRSSVTSGSTIRQSIRSSRPPATNSPHTPQQRHIVSPFTSTSSGSSFRHEEDAVIIELGSRWLRAGSEGDSKPVCAIRFGPEESRRVGDYRSWVKANQPGSSPTEKAFQDLDEWSEDYELWRMDIRNLDVGLFEDKVERAIRDVYNKYLLTDAGSSRLILVLPSLVPHPLLSTLISSIFNRWKYPSITLLPSAAMTAVSAGLRSALVIDIGWEETIVTALYEYREIHSKRSTRAMKLVMQRLGILLTDLAKERGFLKNGPNTHPIAVDFDDCEEILTRLSWCKSRSEYGTVTDDDETQVFESNKFTEGQLYRNKSISIPLPFGNGCRYTEVPFDKFSEPVEKTLFAGGSSIYDLDDEEMPLDVLVYNTLLALPPDVRGACMSRVTFTGGGSNIPGVRKRTLQEVDHLVRNFKWRLTRGKAVDRRVKRNDDSNDHHSEISGDSRPSSENDIVSPTEASNPIDEKFKRANKDAKPYVHGILRLVESLGPWAGASLVANLKVRGVVEIERERFLQHGFAGASRDPDLSAMPERRSAYGSGVGRSGGERSSWTLSEWG